MGWDQQPLAELESRAQRGSMQVGQGTRACLGHSGLMESESEVFYPHPERPGSRQAWLP